VRRINDWLVEGILFIAILFCVRGPVLAQATKFSANVNVVNVLANVFDQRGALIQNLSKGDFVVEDDGRKQDIRYFSRQTELPLTLGLLVDTSGSMSRMLEEEHTASALFFRQMIRPKQDRVFVMNFDEQVRILQTLTSSRKQFESALAHLEPDEFQVPARTSGAAFSPNGRTTALFDAIYLASEALMQNQKGRKALIVISDGMDVNSEYTLDAAITSAQKANTLVYTIHIYDEMIPTLTLPLAPPTTSAGTQPDPAASVDTHSDPAASNWIKAQKKVLMQGKDALIRASRETGGAFFEVSNDTPISKIYQQIENDLRSQYNLGYSPDPSNLASGFHKIRVTTTRTGLTVQARDGYYAGTQ
jgi:VWFA-related protein